MHLYRYSRWDGTQQIEPFTAEDLMEHLADSMLNERDLWSAMRDLLQRGAQFPSGRRMSGLRDLLDRLRQRRQDELGRYNLGSVMDDIREQLEQVLQTEREGIRRRLEGASGPPSPARGEGADPPAPLPAAGEAGRRPEGPRTGEGEGSADEFRRLLEQMAHKHFDQLDNLPPDVGGRIQQLREYDFMDPQARQQFEELLDKLKQQIMEHYFQGMKQALGAMTPEQMAQMKDMLRDLNDLLDAHRHGDDSGFQDFMEKWGQYFPDGIENVDQLAQNLQQRMAQMRSLLDSMTPEMRRELEQMVDSLFRDGGLNEELSELMWNLQRMFPSEIGERFPFQGDEPVSLQEAMRLMGDMKELEELERQLMDAAKRNDASQLDPDRIGELVGEEARQMARELQEYVRMLEEAGFIRRKGKDWVLTPRAMRKIGERALEEIFGRIDGGLSGDHSLTRFGWGIERLDETKRYMFGESFAIDAHGTIMNALRRESASAPLPLGEAGQGREAGAGRVRAGVSRLPIHLNFDDFEVWQSASLNQCSTVIALDMSTSMHQSGLFAPARKVALALDSLIRNKFPRDMLQIVAFSRFVLPLEPHMLLDDYWIDPRGTDIAEALRQARFMLSKRKGGTRQIILITDGAPRGPAGAWGWYGGGYGDRSYRVHDAMEETLQEVGQCTKEGIIVNTFMLQDEPVLMTFVKTMSKINSGRVFFADPNRLGEYLIVDYVKNRRRAG